MTYDPTWIRKSPILIPQAVQNDSLTAQKGSVRLDALDWGQKVGATQLDDNQNGGSCITLSPYNNGKMLAVWSAGTSARYAIVDSDGNMDSTAYQSFVASGFLDYSTGLASALLPNGNIVVAYGKDQGANNAIVFKIVDENGDVVRDEVTVKTHATETQWGIGLAALPDGRFVVTWQEAAAGNMSYFAIYDMDGDVSKGYTSLGGNYVSPKPAPLSDGNWIVTYETGGNVMFRTYDRQGIQIIGETLFKSGVSQASGIRTMGNGQIVVPFTRGFGIIDRQGNVVVAPEVKDSTGSYAVTMLPHDNIVAQNNHGTSGTYKIYDSAGTLIDTQSTYAAEAQGFGASDLATFKNGNFILAYVTGDNIAKFYIHQGTKAGFGGDLFVQGSLSLATGSSVDSISNDGTLVGDSPTALVTEYAVKTYADNIVSETNYRIFDGDSQVAVYDDSTGTSHIDVTVDGNVVANYTSAGFQVGSEAIISNFSNDFSLGGYNGASGSPTDLITEYAVREYIDGIHDAENEPTGFPLGNNDTFITLGLDGSNVVYIEPAITSYDIFLSGQRYVKTSREEIAISDVEGLHYIYFDKDTGALSETTTFNITLLYEHGYIAVLYWDATNKEVIYFGDERHGCTMDGKTHANIHLARGTLYYSGLALSDITPDGTGSLDVEAEFSISNGQITDEDISHVIGARALPANISMFYLDGAGSDWRKEAADNFPVVNTGTGRVAFNEELLGSWQLTEATDGYFVMTHIFATNDHLGDDVIGIVGQAQYATVELARAGAAQEINDLVHGDMPFEEYHPIATLIFETSDAFTNTPKAVIRTNDEGADWTDWRTSGLSPGSGSVTDHGSLSGLAVDDHLQYFRVDGFRSITGPLVAESTTNLQGAVTIDANTTMTAGTLTLSDAGSASIDEFSTDGTLADDSDSAVPTEQAVKTYVDAAIANVIANDNEIFQGDSRVTVIDDGTSAGYIEIVADGVQVAYFDAEATSQRLGKAPSDAGYSVKTSDTSVVAQDTSGNDIINLTQTTQTMGLVGTTTVALNQSTDTITLTANGTAVSAYTDTIQSMGVASNEYITINQTANNITSYVGGTAVETLGASSQIFGISGDSRLVLDQTADTARLYAGTVEVLSASTTTQRFGASGDTALTLNTAADTFTLSAGANTQISGTLTSLALGVSGDTTITLDQSTDSISITAGGQSQVLVETSGTSIYDDLTVTGDLFVDGTTFVVNQTEVRTADNVIVVNYGEPGAGVTAGTAGMQVDRGTLPDYFFVFAENTDTFRVGEEGNTQAVATREDNPIDGYVPYWDDAAKRFDTAGDTYISIDQTAGTIIIAENSIQAMTVDENGLTLLNGATIDEFSTDGTLGDNSNTAVPTEQAVKTYVDNQIFSGGHLISQGDSKVQVYDDGTSTAHVDTVVDGTIVESVSADTQALGVSGDTIISLTQSTDTITFAAAGTTELTIDTDGLTLNTGASVDEFSTDGTLADASDTAVPTEQAVKTYVDTQIANLNPDKIWEGDSYVEVVDDGTNAGYVTIVADGTEVAHFDAQATTQRIGKADQSRMLVADDTVTFYAGITPTVQMTLNGSGMTLASGETVNAISLSTALGTSNTTLVTQGAVKSYIDSGDSSTLSSANSYTDSSIGTLTTYVNNEFADTTAYIDLQDAATLSSANGYTDTEISALRNELDLINMRTVTVDTTAVTGDVVLVDTTAGDVTVEMQTAEDSRIIIKKKTTDGNKVNITTSNGTIDGQNLIIIDTPYQSFTFVSDGSNYYII